MKGSPEKPRYIHPEDSSRGRDFSRSKNNIAVYSEEEQADPRTWPVQNSPLLLSQNYGLSYETTFTELLPEGINIRDFIETGLAAKKGHAIGLDIGGLGSQVFSGFSPGFFAKTAGVTLVDSRESLHIDPEKDTERHHSVIAGDFFQQDTRRRIEEWLDGQKADLIFERMQGGLELVPRDSRIVTTALETLYESLSEEGMMFIQLSLRMHGDVKYALLDMWAIKAWRDAVMEQAGSGLHIAADSNGDSVLIQKLEGAPSKLPQLDLLQDYSRRPRG